MEAGPYDAFDFARSREQDTLVCIPTESCAFLGVGSAYDTFFHVTRHGEPNSEINPKESILGMPSDSNGFLHGLEMMGPDGTAFRAADEFRFALGNCTCPEPFAFDHGVWVGFIGPVGDPFVVTNP